MKKQELEFELENGANGHDEEAEYEALVAEMQAKGIIHDLEKDGPVPLPLQYHQQEKRSNASLLIQIPGVDRLYDKKNMEKGYLLNLMANTTFRSRKEIVYFNKWVSWIDEFTGNYELPIRYCASINSEGGKSRELFADVLTTYRVRNYGTRNKGNFNPKQQQQQGELT